MLRTVLYYPAFAAPSLEWIKDTLLYFDQIGWIETGRDNLSHSAELKELLQEGACRVFSLDKARQRHSDLQHRVTHEFVSRLESDSFQQFVSSQEPPLAINMASDLWTPELIEVLRSKDLCQSPVESASRFPYKVFADAAASMLYLALLAQYIAARDAEAVVPTTSREDYERLLFAGPPEARRPDLALRCLDVLPGAPAAMSIDEVLEFRHKHRAELRSLGSVIDRLERALSEATDDSAIEERLRAFEQDVARGVSVVAAIFEKHRWKRRTIAMGGVLLRRMKPGAEDAVAAAVDAFGPESLIATLGIDAATKAGFGLIEVYKYNSAVQAELQSAARTGYAYVYRVHALSK